MINLPEKYQLAIDGPASSGKSTIAKILAKNFNLVYVDTGAMYRAVTLYAKQNGVAYEEEKAIEKLLKNFRVTFKSTNEGQKVFINGEDVTFDIRTPEIANNVSLVSSYAEVRSQMTQQQRDITMSNGVVMDGRDIGTTVLPNANLKIYLVANVEERANRRFKENVEKGINTPLDVLKQEIIDRDKKDSTRKISPLTKAKDAIEVDTTGMTIDEVVERISKEIEKSVE